MRTAAGSRPIQGKKNGAILNGLKAMTWPAWMHLQTQENGSYRAEDMVELLEKTLPPCDTPEDSVIVLLASFAPHRTQDVGNLVKQKVMAQVA